MIGYQTSKDNRARQFAAMLVVLPLYVLLLLLVRQAVVLSAAVKYDDTPTRSTPADTQATIQPNHGEAAWSRNFSSMPDGPLRQGDWNFESGNMIADYNNEAETYTSRTSNVRVASGALVIEARPEDLNGKHYTSARVNTKGIFDFTYGTLEVDMMLPAGNGTWPAAWLLPASNVLKPADFGLAHSDRLAWALNGEIDFAEAIGSIPDQNIPAAHSYNEVHAAPTYTPAYVHDAYSTYHRYGVIKTPTSITFTLDGVPYASRQKTNNNPLDWPYDQPYYLVVDLALGGNWAGVHGIDDATAPWFLKIRSIIYTPSE